MIAMLRSSGMDVGGGEEGGEEGADAGGAPAVGEGEQPQQEQQQQHGLTSLTPLPRHMQVLIETPGAQPTAGGAGGADGGGTPAPTAALEEPRLEDARLATFIERLPKAELHVHIEGTLEPDLMMALSARNGVALPYADVAAAAAAREHFNNLQEFLDCYHAGMAVLLKRQDYYELTDAYLARAAAEGVRHAEIFFVPQGHTARGVTWADFFPGLAEAVEGAEARHGLTAALIMCFMRDLGPEAAMQTLEEALPYRSQILGVGLESAERGFPPGPFQAVFERAATLGWKRVAHAGEEGGPENDAQLVSHLEATQVPLTVCPLSNLCLQVYSGCLEERLRELAVGTRLALTVNSDDPAYLGGYVCANYAYLARVAGLGPRHLARLAASSFQASFLDPAAKQGHVEAVHQALDAWLHEERVPTGASCRAEGGRAAGAALPAPAAPACALE
ncbi:adenosine deaminase [Micractinium conductrix]|uniref:Adenosine deaminase n=1 Tax=Micractinium conductrix TaxID=554055 RepID=A0A2P6VRX0_9CHLO|nr:adenosine deaminase [Micractinium conductrix]|eukprot:PSC76844.1 adenosine deaminase [Micractinium conductrix]